MVLFPLAVCPDLEAEHAIVRIVTARHITAVIAEIIVIERLIPTVAASTTFANILSKEAFNIFRFELA